MVQMNLSSGSSSNIEVENERTCGHRAGVGWIGRLGLTYVHCHKQMDTGILYTCFYWSIYHNVLQLLEKTMATHSSTLAWKIPWAEEPGGLQSMGSLRVGHDWATSLSLLLSCIGEGNDNPLQCSYLENPRDRGTWWAAVYGVAQNWTLLKQLSSSSRTVITHHVYFTIQIRKFTFVSTISGTLSAIEERPAISVEWVCRERPNLALKTVAV